MELKSLLTRYFLIFTVLLSAQGETDYWYFGYNAGLHFDNNVVSNLTNGKLVSNEGCSTISDSNGNLLFYTDGMSIWDKNNDLMFFGLKGHTSSTQSALIVPYPEKPYLFYIFTTDASFSILSPAPSASKLYYSIIDMRLNNGLGGMSDVRNILLLDNSCEKIAATFHRNGTDVWLLTHSYPTNIYKSFLINSNGINVSPIETTIGFSKIDLWFGDSGQMKFSPRGNYVATVFAFDKVMELLKFDNSTGILSEALHFDFDFFRIINQVYGVEFSYDEKKLYVSSPEKGIYQFDIDVYNQNIIQNSKQLTVVSSFFVKFNPYEYMNRSTALQLGKDKKIYVSKIDIKRGTPYPDPPYYANPDYAEFYFPKFIFGEPKLYIYYDTDYLGRLVPSANSGVNSSWNQKAIFLDDGQIPSFSLGGLPNFISSYFTTRIVLDRYCFSHESVFQISALDDVTSVSWDFGDGSTSTELIPVHIFPNLGSYEITAQVIINGFMQVITKTITIYENPQVSDATLVQCDDDNDGITSFNLEEVKSEISTNFQSEFISFYETELEAITGDLSFYISNTLDYENEIANNDTIWARVENDRGCFEIVRVNLEVTTSQIPDDFMLEVHACDDGVDTTDGIATFSLLDANISILNLFTSSSGVIISYYFSELDALREENAISDISSFQNNHQDQNVFVRVDSVLSNDCLGIGHHVNLHVDAVMQESIQPEWILCNDSSVTISAPSGFDSYLWSTGETTESISVINTGLYTVEIRSYLYNCSQLLTTEVVNSGVAVIDIINTEDWSLYNNIIRIEVHGSGNYEFSVDGVNYQDNNEFSDLNSGNYRIYVRDKNGCGVSVEDIYLLLYPKFFTPNNDGYNDTWQIFDLMDVDFKQLVIYDRYGKKLKVLNSFTEQWDGKLNGIELPASDYWFELKQNNGRKTYKGHFALKR